ncbi:MAG: ACP phosphodiesterase [Bacteroidales bacterium]
MNYLAHIYLSERSTQFRVGNFMADAVKGRYAHKYPHMVAQGIRTHRFIDHYTDTHPLIKGFIERMRPHFGRYSSILLDIYLDHILAKNFRHFTNSSLRLFCYRFYFAVIINYRYLPERFRRFICHFIATDRLGSYRRAQGVRESLEIMVEYRNLDINVDSAMMFLSEQERELFVLLDQFINELKEELVNQQYISKNEYL